MRIILQLILFFLLFGCSINNPKRIEFNNINQKKLISVLSINARLNSDMHFDLPLVGQKSRKYQIEPEYFSFEYDSLNQHIKIFKNWANLDTTRLHTVIQIKFTINNKEEYLAEGYLYENDTLNIPSYGLLGSNAFSIINSKKKIFIESHRGKIENKKLFTHFELDKHYGSEKLLIQEEYRFKLQNNVSYIVDKTNCCWE